MGFIHGDSRESTHFRQRIRSYNNVLSLTSLGTTETPYRQNNGGVYSFRIKGALYHNHGPLLPIDGERPKFAQIYVHDSRDLDAQVSHRMNVFQDNSLDQTILSTLTQLLQQCNWLVQTYETAGETLRSNPQLPVTLQLKVLNPWDKDPRTYNVPTADEIGILIVGSGDEEFDKRDIIIQARSGENEYQGLTRISEINPYYLALQYELLAQQRQDNPTTARGGSKHVSLAMWHSFHLFEREGTRSLLHCGGRLFQEWVVDAAAVNEQNSLRWVRQNQSKLRAQALSGLMERLDTTGLDSDLESVGHRVIPPS
ncbi:hypothetical protein L873DRAFT_1940408, partial [Choiromyces venosus 120613-1]